MYSIKREDSQFVNHYINNFEKLQSPAFYIPGDVGEIIDSYFEYAPIFELEYTCDLTKTNFSEQMKYLEESDYLVTTPTGTFGMKKGVVRSMESAPMLKTRVTLTQNTYHPSVIAGSHGFVTVTILNKQKKSYLLQRDLRRMCSERCVRDKYSSTFPKLNVFSLKTGFRKRNLVFARCTPRKYYPGYEMSTWTKENIPVKVMLRFEYNV
eukprot:551285_1